MQKTVIQAEIAGIALLVYIFNGILNKNLV